MNYYYFLFAYLFFVLGTLKDQPLEPGLDPWIQKSNIFLLSSVKGQYYEDQLTW